VTSNNAGPLKTAGHFKRLSEARTSRASAVDSTTKFVPPAIEKPGKQLTAVVYQLDRLNVPLHNLGTLLEFKK
jgi:hypothetical protein